MAERLTKKIRKTIQDKYSLGSYLYYDYAGLDDTNKLLNKLGKLEDILEKYGVDIQNLDYILEDYSKNQGRYFAICEERDTWKRACELACGTIISEEIDGEDLYDVIEKWKVERDIETYGFDDRFLTDYFYQQAKKEKEKN